MKRNRLVETYFRNVANKAVNEMVSEDMDKVAMAMPMFKHTDRAFLPGDKLFIERRANKSVNYPAYKITAVNGNELTLVDSNRNKLTASTQLDAICTTDTWLRVFNLFSNDGENGLLPGSVFFDYEEIDGELYVTMMIKAGASFANGSKIGYKYSDIKAGGKPEYIRLAIESEREKVELYCKEGETIPFKSKSYQSGAVRVNPQWVATEPNGKFRGWLYGKRRAIVEECPWLRDMSAKWCDSKGTVRNIPISKYL